MSYFNLKFIVLLCIFFLPAGTYASKGNGADTEAPQVCIEVLGLAVDENNKPIPGVQVRLLLENEELEWIEVTSVAHHDHSFKFSLYENRYYTIEVSKPGFVSRSIVVSTVIPANISLEQVFRYEFDLQLFREKLGADDYYLDFPVALISYDDKKQLFNYSHNYTKHIKTKIKETTGLGHTNAIRQTKNN